jgi:hypothetical protein
MTTVNNKESIIRLLEIIIERSTMINKYTEQIPQIEIDLILSDIRDLYQMYSNINNTPTTDNEQKEAFRRKENEIVREVEKQSSTAPLGVLKNEEVKEKAEPQIAKEVEKPAENLSVTTNQIFAEKKKEETYSINDKIGLNKADNSIATKINEHQLSDIRKGIGINEKILFIKELFKGNVEEYDDSITKFNLFKSHQEAEEFYKNLQNKYNWDLKTEACISLKNLIDRKFV